MYLLEMARKMGRGLHTFAAISVMLLSALAHLAAKTIALILLVQA